MRDEHGKAWSYYAKWAYLLLVVFVLLLPVFYIIYISFNEHGFGAAIYEFTVDWYRVVLSDRMLVASLEWTAYLALGAVASAVPLGLLAAKFCKSSRNKVPFVTLMLMPLFVPADIMGSSLLVFFKNLNGFFEWLSDCADWSDCLYLALRLYCHSHYDVALPGSTDGSRKKLWGNGLAGILGRGIPADSCRGLQRMCIRNDPVV